MSDSKYRMTVDLSVLESLGINLYSNAAAVLSELVANAYDADSTEVSIDWKQSQNVVVADNGSGMTADELNNRFLYVGYKKRENEGVSSPVFGRPYMGRKGIGKLSVFSIAEVVTVYSTKDGQSNGFRIDVSELETAIKCGGDYSPEEVEVPDEYQRQGTILVLDSLKSKRADLTASALRKRLARRFDVLDRKSPAEGGFSIVVNGSPISYLDRQDLKKLEFIWEFGSKSLEDAVLPKDITRYVLPGEVNKENGWEIRGWFGTAKRPTDLTEDEEAGSLKNIIVLARKRPIQEGIIEKLDFSRIFGNYVTGQIEADFLDLDDEDDIATSDRQRLIEDDDRVVALQKMLRAAFVTAADQWSDARPKKTVPNALDKYPKIKEWINGLDRWQKPYAESMIGTIASLDFEPSAEDQRVQLFRSGILAFARVGLRKATEDLESLSKISAADLLPLLSRQEEYEAGLWVDILRSRVEAISTFRDLTSANEKEKVLQEHLFSNLWLLDASWERATESARMEQKLKDMAESDFKVSSEKKDELGRIDIRYATASGRHVIVELKRYSVRPDVDDLRLQGQKYAVSLKKALEKAGNADPIIEVIFVLGDQPKAANPGLLPTHEYQKRQFETINGRVVLYDELIENALAQYDEYLGASEKAKQLDELLESIG
ncbi:hypothetical protein GS490_15630 [Rhodococcus hoagii]|nr:hypothetical protein [Prescottella equi]